MLQGVIKNNCGEKCTIINSHNKKRYGSKNKKRQKSPNTISYNDKLT